MDRSKPVHSRIFPETPQPRTERADQHALQPEEIPVASKDDLRVLAYQIEVLQRRVKELEAKKDYENRIELFVGRWEEFLSSAELRFEKIQEQFHKQNEGFRVLMRDLQSKVSALLGWMKQKDEGDAQIREVIERQQQAVLACEARMQQMQKSFSNLELQALNSESNKARFSKIQTHLQRQNEAIQAAFKDVRSQIEAVATRTNDRQLSESSIREMVERQQRLIQSFEFRLQQAQKVMSEQELQLMNSRSEFKESLKELARLKQL